MEIILIFVLILIYVLMLALIVGGLIIFDNVLISIYVVTLALIASVPIVIDMLLAHYSANNARKQLTEKLIGKTSFNELEIEELKELIKETGKAPTGIKGIYRTTMALTVIMILGIAVFHVLVMDVSGGNLQILNNILSMLAGLLAAITGFYFGGRTAETAYQEKEEGITKPPEIKGGEKK